MKAKRQLITAITASCIALAGCEIDEGSSGSRESPAYQEPGGEPVEVALSGGAAKGVMRDAQVEIHEMEEGEWNLVGSTMTDQEGVFDINIMLSGTPVKIDINASSNTTMVCDALDGCGVHSFGEVFFPDDGFSLHSVVPFDGTEKPITVSFLTHLAAQWVDTFPVVSNQAVAVANNRVAGVFGLDVGFYRHTPLDITLLESLESADQKSISHAWVAGALANIVGKRDEYGFPVASSLEEGAEAFIGGGGQLSPSFLSEVASEVMALDQYLEGDFVSPATDLAASLDAWTGDVSDAPLDGEVTQASFDQAVSIIDEFQHYMDVAGVNEEGDFLEEQALLTAWDHGEHRGFGEVESVTRIRSMIGSVTAGHVLENPDDSAILDKYFNPDYHTIDIQDPSMAAVDIYPWYRNHYLDVNIGVTPLPQIASQGSMVWNFEGSILSEEIETGMSLLSSVEFHAPDITALVDLTQTQLMSELYGSDLGITSPDPADVYYQIEQVTPDLQADMYIDLEGSIGETHSSGSVVKTLVADVGIDVPGALLGGPLVSAVVEELGVVMPNGDQIFSHQGTNALEIELGDDIQVLGELGVEAFGWPEMHFSLDGQIEGVEDPAGKLVAVSESLDDLELVQEELDALLGLLERGPLDFRGTMTASVPSNGDSWEVVFSRHGAAIGRPGAGESAFSVYPGTAGNVFIYAGEELIGLLGGDNKGLGVHMELLGGDERIYRLGATESLVPSGLPGMIFSWLGQAG